MPASSKKEKGLQYEIVRQLGDISEIEGEYTKELNYVSWNNNEPKYDIRDWNNDHTRASKGITLTLGEMLKLKGLIEKELENLNKK
ncbi:Bacterial seryl-tRNA synthetase related [Mycoplasmopsis meleagridis]|uniref:Bacterial seryl-tRNA synthetase-like protein n=1 Tax=Mycoplasmopsis meleagridis ATCC 25294 TaxID=1264554 RepID=A0A0F5H0I3_9BACT|nr:PC4/YdbC family ssDNA-binding protein [Mycoplasmopsis meleagridis]KKB26635.1 Bacterial seryl-tRNA synthetase-like protein [Mycoplasmopsis meleagridis ATCC 25294]KUH47660.1 hypothetical protein ASB56_00815 [Mycoplasmopsis meleagridis]OAD18250.1 Bacterial seryl-tRNA synthetase related [Mycoplasmopsis meleagridis]VEU77689.1 Uncharacterized protein conserved in bacteria [Mycoplasmopsis meleagridis]